MYEVPCSNCDRTYVGQTNRHISERIREHTLAVTRGVSTSALTQHVSATGHHINFQDTKLIAAIEHKPSRIIREQIEIEKRTNALNKRSDGLHLHQSWKTAINNIGINQNTRWENQPTYSPEHRST